MWVREHKNRDVRKYVGEYEPRYREYYNLVSNNCPSM